MLQNALHDADRRNAQNDDDDSIAHLLSDRDGQWREFDGMSDVQRIECNGVPDSNVGQIHSTQVLPRSKCASGLFGKR